MKTYITPPSSIRTMFSRAMSDMYRIEVPQYATLIDLVRDVNLETRQAQPQLDDRLRANQEIERLDLERHGAVRLGTAQELFTIRRLFAVMGMSPVGYYDLSLAGVPVHATAFRPLDPEELRLNPFRVFTSLLRLDLIEDIALRHEAADILSRRSIFTPRCLDLIEQAEQDGGLDRDHAEEFVQEALETFRWHRQATVTAEVYQRLRDVHPLIADIVCFKGPHINHLTPRTLDIDRAQAEMPARGITAKAVIEGPPRRAVPILLRQTSFRALKESIAFVPSPNTDSAGTHVARFGEIEQRGAALTPKGRDLYDRLLEQVRGEVQVKSDGSNAADYDAALLRHFSAFPDDEATLRAEGLAYFRYRLVSHPSVEEGRDLNGLIARGHVAAEPLVYEDFLPVSAAGIFSSNLGDEGQRNHAKRAAKDSFEADLGAQVHDSDTIYAAAEQASLAQLDAMLTSAGATADEGRASPLPA